MYFHVISSFFNLFLHIQACYIYKTLKILFKKTTHSDNDSISHKLNQHIKKCHTPENPVFKFFNMKYPTFEPKTKKICQLVFYNDHLRKNNITHKNIFLGYYLAQKLCFGGFFAKKTFATLPECNFQPTVMGPETFSSEKHFPCL